MRFLADRGGNELEKIADDIQELLEERGEPMSFTYIAESLPYDRNRVKLGLQEAQEEFIVDRVESEDGSIKWKTVDSTGGGGGSKLHGHVSENEKLSRWFDEE